MTNPAPKIHQELGQIRDSWRVLEFLEVSKIPLDLPVRGKCFVHFMARYTWVGAWLLDLLVL